MATDEDLLPTALDPLLLARAALAAARGVAGVVGISRGRYAIARTAGLGGTVVEGVQLSDGASGLQVELHLVVGYVPIPPLARAVRVAVAGALGRLGAEVAVVDVWVDAIRLAGQEEEPCRS